MSFADDVRELRRLMKANVDAGYGNQSLIRAVEEQKALQAARADKPAKQTPERRHGRTFLLSFLFGAIWSGSRRRR